MCLLQVPRRACIVVISCIEHRWLGVTLGEVEQSNNEEDTARDRWYAGYDTSSARPSCGPNGVLSRLEDSQGEHEAVLKHRLDQNSPALFW